jgi:hypothetical protein
VIGSALLGWARLEVAEGWRSWGRRGSVPQERPAKAGAPILDYAVTR